MIINNHQYHEYKNTLQTAKRHGVLSLKSENDILTFHYHGCYQQDFENRQIDPSNLDVITKSVIPNMIEFDVTGGKIVIDYLMPTTCMSVKNAQELIREVQNAIDLTADLQAILDIWFPSDRFLQKDTCHQ